MEAGSSRASTIRLVALYADGARPHRRLTSCCRPSFQNDQPLDVVDQIGHSDLGGGPCDADGADEEIHAILLLGKDMFNAAADLGFHVIRPTRRLRHRLALWFLAMDAADKAIVGHESLVGTRPIGRVGPNGARGIGLVEQSIAQHRPFISGRIRRMPLADQAVTDVDGDVVLIAEARDGDIDWWF